MHSSSCRAFLGALLAGLIAIAGCSNEGAGMQTSNATANANIALAFVQSLAAPDHVKAYAMTSSEFRARTTAEQLNESFENIVPSDWGPIGPIEIVESMTNWPDKRGADLAWIHVSIGGDVYSEAMTVVLVSEAGEPRIREAEFGRP